MPVSLALIPNQALIYSIDYDVGATLFIWSAGPLLLSKTSKNLNNSIKFNSFVYSISNSPAIKGLIGALLIQLTPWKEQITSILWIPSKIVILSSVAIVGMSLAHFRAANHLTIKEQFSHLNTAMTMKLIGYRL